MLTGLKRFLVAPVKLIRTDDENRAGAEFVGGILDPPVEMTALQVMNLVRPRVAVGLEGAGKGFVKAQPAEYVDFLEQAVALFPRLAFKTRAGHGVFPSVEGTFFTGGTHSACAQHIADQFWRNKGGVRYSPPLLCERVEARSFIV